MSDMPKSIWAGINLGRVWSDSEDYWSYRGCTRYLRADEVEAEIERLKDILRDALKRLGPIGGRDTELIYRIREMLNDKEDNSNE